MTRKAKINKDVEKPASAIAQFRYRLPAGTIFRHKPHVQAELSRLSDEPIELQVLDFYAPQELWVLTAYGWALVRYEGNGMGERLTINVER